MDYESVGLRAPYIQNYFDKAEHHQTAIKGLLCAASSPSLATQSETAGVSYVKCVIQRKVLGKRRGGIPTSNMTPRSGNIAKWMGEHMEEITRDSRYRAIMGEIGAMCCMGGWSSFLTGQRKTKKKTELNSKQHHRVTHLAWFSSQLFKIHSTGLPKNIK